MAATATRSTYRAFVVGDVYCPGVAALRLLEDGPVYVGAFSIGYDRAMARLAPGLPPGVAFDITETR